MLPIGVREILAESMTLIMVVTNIVDDCCLYVVGVTNEEGPGVVVRLLHYETQCLFCL